jgi:parallel beta-helix repeat protein
MMRNTEAYRSQLVVPPGILLLLLLLGLSGSEQSRVGAQSITSVRRNLRVVDQATSPSNTIDLGVVIRGIRPRGFGATAYTVAEPSAGRIMYFVAPTGDDSYLGTSSAPFRTINRAAQVAVAGDVVTIRDGTYRESVLVRNSGTADKRIVFQAETRGGVVLTGGQYNFQPAAWMGGKVTKGQFYVTIKGLIFRGYTTATDGASALRGVTGWYIEDCLFDGPGRNGLDLRGDFIHLTRSTIQYAYQHALVAWGPANGATSPTDPRFEGIRDLRITDTILRGNFHLDQPLEGSLSSSVAKIVASRGALIDNIESYENNGPGLWFDTDNFEYIVRNSYFHDNNYLGTGYSPGRGLHIEISWAPGLVESNIFADNAHEGLAVNNSQGLTVRNNLFVNNLRHIRMSNWDRGVSYPLRDIRIEYNQFKDWQEHAAIEPLGDLTASSLPAKNVTADYNVYEPIRSTWLAGWWSDVGAITTIDSARTRLRWEMNGRLGTVKWPLSSPNVVAQSRDVEVVHFSPGKWVILMR